MAIGWVSIIPWGEVIKAAPEIIDGAKKLWNAVRKPTPPETPPQPVEPPLSPEAVAIATLKNRIEALESSAVALQSQMQVSSELIKGLADQNGQLVARLEIHRKRLLWLVSVTIISIITTVTCLVLLLAKNA